MLGFAILGLLGMGIAFSLLDDGDEASIFSSGSSSDEGTEDADFIDSGDGDNRVFAGGGDDIVLAGDGDDRVFGGAGDDLIAGEGGDDFLRGGSGDDVIIAGAGQDVVHGDIGNDYIEGIDITDTRSIIEITEASIRSGIPLSQQDLDRFVDLKAATEEADVLNGGMGDDVIIAGSNDQVDTGTGFDTVHVGLWVNPLAPVQINDFDPFMDEIVYTYEGIVPPTVTFDETDEGTATLVVDGEIVAFFEKVDFLDLLARTPITLERFA
jgi:Ca2+-binding RTX toxin-like protein